MTENERLELLKKILRRAATKEAIKTAHHWEPFPLYKAASPKQKFVWWLVKARWFLVKKFIKNKSFLNGRTFT